MKTYILLFIPLFFISCVDFTIPFSEQEVEETLNRKFPIKYDKLVIVKGVLDKVSVDFIDNKNDQKVKISIPINLKMLSFEGEKSYHSKIIVSAGIIYNRENYSFYLSNFTFEKLDIAKVKRKLLKKIEREVNPIISELLKDIPIYTLPKDRFEYDLARLILKSVDIDDNILNIVVGF